MEKFDFTDVTEISISSADNTTDKTRTELTLQIKLKNTQLLLSFLTIEQFNCWVTGIKALTCFCKKCKISANDLLNHVIENEDSASKFHFLLPEELSQSDMLIQISMLQTSCHNIQQFLDSVSVDLISRKLESAQEEYASFDSVCNIALLCSNELTEVPSSLQWPKLSDSNLELEILRTSLQPRLVNLTDKIEHLLDEDMSASHEQIRELIKNALFDAETANDIIARHKRRTQPPYVTVSHIIRKVKEAVLPSTNFHTVVK